MFGKKHQKGNPRALAGFSLVELLVTIGIICVLAVLGTGAFQGALDKGRMVKETTAAKNLINAYTLSAGDNDGRYMPGMDYTVNSVWFEPQGKNLTMIHLANRYPFRLAPYFNYSLNGTILLNRNVSQIEKMSPSGNPLHEYVISTYPAFGMNYWFVGGCVADDGTLSYPQDCLSRSSQTASLLAFASGGAMAGTTKVDGYNILTPPKLEGDRWVNASWTKNANPGNYGNVDARYNGKAVCAYLDGSVRMQSIDELRDMRLWNKSALEQNAPNYSISN